jgi:hypothetical protein
MGAADSVACLHEPSALSFASARASAYHLSTSIGLANAAHTHAHSARASCTQSVSHCDAISAAFGLGLCTRAAAEGARHARVRVVLAADAEPAVGAVAPREAAQTNTHTHTQTNLRRAPWACNATHLPRAGRRRWCCMATAAAALPTAASGGTTGTRRTNIRNARAGHGGGASSGLSMAAWLGLGGMGRGGGGVGHVQAAIVDDAGRVVVAARDAHDLAAHGLVALLLALLAACRGVSAAALRCNAACCLLHRCTGGWRTLHAATVWCTLQRCAARCNVA